MLYTIFYFGISHRFVVYTISKWYIPWGNPPDGAWSFKLIVIKNPWKQSFFSAPSVAAASSAAAAGAASGADSARECALRR